ncbi:MAG TPA: hypothetical protein VFO26_02655, partial [Gaiella sp.]|uniref:ATP-binding protein n=1 Tax=Gaiella sp. TaxID=2663207 RepID=UPI002D7F26BC
MLEEIGDEAYDEVLTEHRRIVRNACTEHAGVEVDNQGDAFFFAFPTAPGALAAASGITSALSSGPIRLRIGLHTGEARVSSEGYVGREVHFAARVAATGHGGQIVLSGATAALVQAELTDLGEHRLKDIAEPVPLYHLGDGAFPPLRTISNTNLPRPASSFVGREAELANVFSKLEQGARLLTLTGPGGSGKTRLALEAAATLVPKYKAGVLWVGLAALRDAALVTETIAQTIGARGGLAEHVGERELLLLLDNLEQVVESAPELASLLESCPNLTLLVTSRELLRVRGEVEYPVPPLAEPEAVELFCARSQLEPSEEIAELCRRLDLLPLAVELASARMKALTPKQILQRLSRRLDLLKGGRDADPRQRTLRATIEWSHELLSEAEQRLFARLSVFAGGATLETAESVTGADVDSLQSLVERNLLRFSDGRYWMLETIREFAAERLGNVERVVLRERLAGHVVASARGHGSPLFLGRQVDAAAELDAEHPNVREVVLWALDSGRPELFVALCAELWPVWIARGHAPEANTWVARAFDEIMAGDDPAALGGAGKIASHAGDRSRAISLMTRLLDLLSNGAQAAPYWETGALADLADLAVDDGDLARARAYAERSLQLCRQSGRPYARALASLGDIALREGDLDAAEAALEEAASGFRAFGNESLYANALALLGEVARRRGDGIHARNLLTDAVKRFAALGAQGAVGDCLLELAIVHADEGELMHAGRLWGAGQAL